MRTNFYIDGFNLYKGCLECSPHKWLNLVEFCRQSFPPPHNLLHRVRYFTARIRAWPHDPQQPERQSTYLRALGTLPEVSIHFGQFKTDKPWMKLITPLADGTTTLQVERSREKGSDVNLAAYLLMDGFKNDYEAAVVVTNDPDLREPIRMVRADLGKHVIMLFPIRAGRFGSNELKKVSNLHNTVDPAILAACQFSRFVIDAKGRQIHKPVSW